MTTKEKIEALDNLIGMVDDNHGTDYDEALKSAKRSLDAWDKVIEEIENTSIADFIATQTVLEVIKKHLGEVET